MSGLLIFGSVVMILLAIAIIAFVVVYQRRMYDKHRKIVDLELENQRRLVEAEIRATEREQKRIAQDLHDDTGASLTSLRFHIAQLDDSPQKTAINKTLSETTYKVRNVCNELLPYTLEELGLSDSLSYMSKRLNDTVEVDVNFVLIFDDKTVILGQNEELAMYRIVQELLSNIVKYAQASYIDILLTMENNLMKLEIVDDGTGFIPMAKDYPDSFGLQNIVSRLRYINGSMVRSKRRNKGTTVEISKSFA